MKSGRIGSGFGPPWNLASMGCPLSAVWRTVMM